MARYHQGQAFPSLHLFGLVIFLVCFSLSLSTTETSKKVGDVSDNEKKEPQSDTVAKPKDPLVDGMEIYYKLVNGFLDVTQRDGDGSLLGIINITSLTNGNLNYAQFTTFKFWKPYLVTYVGYLVCFVIGVLYIILMPIIGLCFCCCRCCGKCGGKADVQDPRNAKFKRATCGLFFFIFTMLLLAATVCAFLTNDLLRRQTTGDDSALRTLNNSLINLDDYLSKTVKEINVAVVDRYDKSAVSMKKTLSGTGELFQSEIGKVTNASSALEDATLLADSVSALKTSLDVIDASKTKLTSDIKNLNTKLDDIKTNVLSAVAGCTANECKKVETKANELKKVPIDLTKLPDITKAKDEITKVFDANITGLVTKANESFDNISKDINTKIETQIKKSQVKIDDVKKQLEDVVSKLVIQVNNVKKPMANARKSLSGYEENVEKYGNIRTYACIGIACILGLIVFFNIFGLLFGACGERPYEDAGCCNKGIGANMIMASVGFTFLFGWLLMIVTTLLFLTGGMAYTEVCRQMQAPEFKAIQQIQSQVNDFIDLNFTLDIADSLGNCAEDQALYTAFKMQQFININKTMKEYETLISDEITKVVDAIKNKSIPTVDILTADMETQLDNLKKADINNINIDAALAELKTPLSTVDLNTLLKDLEALKPLITDPTKKASLDAAVKDLNDVIITDIPNIEKQITELIKSLETIKNNKDITTKVDKIVASLTDAQTNINNKANDLKTKAADKISKDIQAVVSDYLTDVAKAIQYDVGKCKPVYSSIVEMIDVGCVDILYPLNGFWFSIGWFLIISILSLIFGVKLVGLYRKTEKYVGKGQNFNDDNYQGIYPGDNIPLESVPAKQKHYRNGQGLQNTGYDKGNMQDYSRPPQYSPPGQPSNWQNQNPAIYLGGTDSKCNGITDVSV